MPYNFAAGSFYTKKLCSRLSSSKVRFFYANRRFCVFQTPFGGLRGNVRRSSWAYWKARSGLPININWTFFARRYGWGAMSDYRFKIGDFAATGAGSTPPPLEQNRRFWTLILNDFEPIIVKREVTGPWVASPWGYHNAHWCISIVLDHSPRWFFECTHRVLFGCPTYPAPENMSLYDTRIKDIKYSNCVTTTSYK